MDKYEYNLRNEEINTLIGRREFQKAVAIADTIDWTKVRSVKTLCKISDLYKVNKRYKESKILLEQALMRYPNGKNIVSSLCDLCIRMNDVVGALEYYKQFVQMAPTDNTKFILLYKIYEAQEATLDERIEVLEGLKKRERIEKWCYELALLYHRTGLTSKCVEECDDLILWFREGKYVKKAMELKMLHQQLTGPQDVLYINMLEPEERAEYIDRTASHAAVEDRVEEEQEEILVKTVDVGQYSTINIQKALEESIKGTLSESSPYQTGDLFANYGTGSIEQGDDVTKIMPSREAGNINYELEANIRQTTGSLSAKYAEEYGQEQYVEAPVAEYEQEQYVEAPVAEYEQEQYAEVPVAEYEQEQYAEAPATEYEQEQYAEAPAIEYEQEQYAEAPAIEYEQEQYIEKPVREVNYSPSLQDTAEMQELFFNEPTDNVTQDEVIIQQPQTVSAIYEQPAEMAEIKYEPQEVSISEVAQPEESVETKEDIASQVVFPDVPVSGDTIVYNKGDIVNQVANAVLGDNTEENAPVDNSSSLDALSNASKEELIELIDKKVAEALENAMRGQSMTASVAPKKDNLSQVAPPRSMQKMLSQEPNGQISMVVPEQDQVEKQITGQINIEEYLTSWEDTKQQNKQKYEAEIKNRLMKETGDLFTEFEAEARDSILAKIEDDKSQSNGSAIVDADKEYEEYLKRLLAESEKEEQPVVNQIDDVQSMEESEEMVLSEEQPANESEMEELPEVEEIEEIEEPTEAEEDNESEVNPALGVVGASSVILEEPAVVQEESEEIEEIEEIEEEPVAEENIETEEEPVAEENVETEEELSAEPEEVAVEETDSNEEPEETDEPEEAADTTDAESKEAEETVESDSPVETKTEEADKIKEESVKNPETSDENVREMTEEEISLFAQFFQTKKAKQNLIKALDNISLASYTGNVFVSGEMGEEPVELAKNVVQYAKVTDGNFSGKIGKVTGMSLNGKDLGVTIGKMSNGGLIIERAGDMREETVQALLKVLNQDNLGVLVVMQDTKVEMSKMYSAYPEMNQVFNVQIEIEELSDDALVAFGRKYAERMEYSIDEMGILALHTRIDEMQTCDHVVTVADVRDIIDDAIENATRFSPKHITDIIFGKRYDDEDMIILKERDFIN